MLLILRKLFDLIIRWEVSDMTVQRMSHNFVQGQSVSDVRCLRRWGYLGNTTRHTMPG